MRDEDLASRQAIRRQWWALLAFVLVTAIASAVIGWGLYEQQQDHEEQIAEILENEQATVQQTLRGCQRGNELRRAIRQVQSEFARECPLCRAAQLDIDADAIVIDDCRATVESITGVVLPPGTSNFVGGE